MQNHLVEFENVSQDFIQGLIFANGGRTHHEVQSDLKEKFQDDDFFIGFWEGGVPFDMDDDEQSSLKTWDQKWHGFISNNVEVSKPWKRYTCEYKISECGYVCQFDTLDFVRGLATMDRIRGRMGGSIGKIFDQGKLIDGPLSSWTKESIR